MWVLWSAVIQTFLKVSMGRRKASLTDPAGGGVEGSSHPAPLHSPFLDTAPGVFSCHKRWRLCSSARQAVDEVL